MNIITQITISRFANFSKVYGMLVLEVEFACDPLQLVFCYGIFVRNLSVVEVRVVVFWLVKTLLWRFFFFLFFNNCLFRLSHGLNLVDLNFLVFDFFSGNSLKGFILDIVLLLNLFIFRLFGSHRLLLSFISSFMSLWYPKFYGITFFSEF